MCSQSPKASYVIVLREEVHCLAAVVISMVTAFCMSAFPALYPCSNAECHF